MPIEFTATLNTTYGGDLITSKYSPLAGKSITATGSPASTAPILATRRAEVNRLLAANLELFGPVPAGGLATGGRPPMIVISSGRAGIVRDLLATAVTRGPLGDEGYRDPTTFRDGLSAWYSPIRSGRPLFLLVHLSEADTYRRALVGGGLLGNPSDVYLFAWRFRLANAAPPNLLVGFGACRYAALALARQQARAQVWIVDDNVVNVNGCQPTLDALEAWALAGGAVRKAVGFRGATKMEPAPQTLVLAKKGLTATPIVLPQAPETGFAQQAVLWNVANLVHRDRDRQDHPLNFAPLFLTSNEDASFVAFLQKIGGQVCVLGQGSVLKVQAGGVTPPIVEAARTRLLEALRGGESSAVTLNGRPTDDTLGALTWAGDPLTPAQRDRAQSQIIEQITTKMIGDAPVETFADLFYATAVAPTFTLAAGA